MTVDSVRLTVDQLAGLALGDAVTIESGAGALSRAWCTARTEAQDQPEVE
jgi:hypothetical protein